MIPLETFEALLDHLTIAGWAKVDIAWAESLTCPRDADDFATEVIFVICNSGMKFTIARAIYDRCIDAIADGRPVASVFGHAGKAEAIETVWRAREGLFESYLLADDKLYALEQLPWVGGITKFHLAKNFGLPVAKPDVHLVRLADRFGTDAQTLCEDLSRRTGYAVATVDTLLWRACATGVLDPETMSVGPARIRAGEAA